MVISARPTAQVQTHTADTDEASFGELAARVSEQVSRLVRDEFALAQLEAKEKAKRLGVGIGMFGASGILAVFGALAGVAAAILALAYLVPGWLAALIVAGALLFLAAVLALAGHAGVKRGSPPLPTAAVESAKTDVATVREAVKR
jgi:Flp pilus assembly protein TadB